MGGLSTALSSLGDKIGDSKIGQAIGDKIGWRSAEYAKSPEGKLVGQMVEDFKAKNAQYTHELSGLHSTLVKGIAGDSPLRNSISLADTKLGDITDHLKQNNHPLHSVARTLENQTAGNFSKTLGEIEKVNAGEAKVRATTDVFGKNFQNLTGLIINLQDHPDPRMETHANRLIQTVSAEIKDVTKIGAPKGGGQINVSSAAKNVAETLTKVNKTRQNIIKNNLGSPKLLRPQSIDLESPYKEAGPKEKEYSNFVRMVQVPLVAIPHIGTYFNLGSAPLKSLYQGIMSEPSGARDKLVEASGVLTATMHDMIHAKIEGLTGVVSKIPFLDKGAGTLLYEATHAPGFNYLREKQLWFGASVGYHAAQNWAQEATQGSKRAVAELLEMHLDPQKIIERGGQLTNDELKTAMFHFTNNRFFINRSQDMPLHSNSGFVMRSATMYHAFLTAQVHFMGREFKKMAEARDYVGIAQFAGTLGVLFPAVAPLIKSLEILGRTGSPSQAKDSAATSYSNLSGAKGPGGFAKEYGELLLHIGGMGVFTNYMEAAANHRLQAAVSGPLISTPISLAEDIYHSTQANKSGKFPYKPALRDTLQDAVPIVGKPLSHWLAPTLKEEPKIELSRRTRGRRRR